MSVSNLSHLRGRPDAGDIYNRLIETYELVQQGSGSTFLTNALFVDAIDGTPEGQRGNLNAPFATVQQAIDAAQPDDRIVLLTNITNQNAVVPDDKPLSIIGLGKRVISWRGDDSEAVTLTTTSSLRLQGFRLRAADDAALRVQAGAGPVGVVYLNDMLITGDVEISDTNSVGVVGSEITSDVSMFNVSNASISLGTYVDGPYIHLTNASLDLASDCADVTVVLDDGAYLYAQPRSRINTVDVVGENTYVSVERCFLEYLSGRHDGFMGFDDADIRYLNLLNAAAPTPATFTARLARIADQINLGDDVTLTITGTNNLPSVTVNLGSNAVLLTKHRYGQSSTPSASDDASKAIDVGSEWFTTSGDVFKCSNATVDAATWIQLNGV